MRMTALAAAAADRHHRRAVRFFWSWLAMATTVSLAGNVIHALITTPSGTRWLAASVAAVPPVVLLFAVHGLAVLAKTSASGAVYRCAVAATSMLALGAFLLSFVALRDLAVIAGIRPGLAAVLPLVIDLAMGVATLALVAIGDKPARRKVSAARTATPSAAVDGALMLAPEAPPRRSGATAHRVASARETASLVANDMHSVAAYLVAAKVTRQSAETVAQILSAHNAGEPLNRIAKDLGVHHSAVSKILEAAAQRRVRAA